MFEWIHAPCCRALSLKFVAAASATLPSCYFLLFNSSWLSAIERLEDDKLSCCFAEEKDLPFEMKTEESTRVRSCARLFILSLLQVRWDSQLHFVCLCWGVTIDHLDRYIISMSWVKSIHTKMKTSIRTLYIVLFGGSAFILKIPFPHLFPSKQTFCFQTKYEQPEKKQVSSTHKPAVTRHQSWLVTSLMQNLKRATSITAAVSYSTHKDVINKICLVWSHQNTALLKKLTGTQCLVFIIYYYYYYYCLLIILQNRNVKHREGFWASVCRYDGARGAERVKQANMLKSFRTLQRLQPFAPLPRHNNPTPWSKQANWWSFGVLDVN